MYEVTIIVKCDQCGKFLINDVCTEKNGCIHTIDLVHDSVVSNEQGKIYRDQVLCWDCCKQTRGSRVRNG